MSGSPIVYAALTLAFGLVGGLLPLFSKIKDNPERLKMLTGIAAGIIIASAILVVIPEGFELAKEEAFISLTSDKLTEDGVIMTIRNLLDVENAFRMVLMYEEGDTQISITWNDQDEKRIVEDYCEDCKTKKLRKMIGGLVDKLVGGL